MNNKPPATLIPFILSFLRAQRTSFFWLSALALMWPLEQVMFPYIVKMIIDVFSTYEGDRSQVYGALSHSLWLGTVLWISSVVAWRFADLADYFFSPRFQANIRESMTRYVFGHSHRYFSEHLAGSMSNKIADIVRGAHYIVTHTVKFFFPSLVTALLTSAVMATINPVFAIILLAWTVVHLGICAYYSRQCDYASHAHSEIRSELQGRIVDSISNFITVRLFARRDSELDYIRQFQTEEIKAHRRMLFTIAKVKMILEIPCFMMAVALIYALIHAWQAGTVGSGDTAFILSTTINLMYLLWRVGMEFPSFFREIGVCQQALSLVSVPNEIVDSSDAKPLVVRSGEIAFENVSFQYHPGQNLFSDKNILIKPGQKVGLVGFSGSGKSTFANLILRLYDLEDGHIYIDGQDVARVTQDSLRAQIALIPQDPVLFHRSLRENIAYGNPDASEADILKASMQAHCHEFIQHAEHGYDSIVGERGIKLSGGQRQRIAIARAILKNAPVLIFDEATSSLDSATETAIQDSLRTLTRDRTTIVIAHRLSTLMFMDRLLVFRDGVIIEDGTHAALLEKGGHYARLWQMQVGGFLPDLHRD
jgi:ATP-binding cassette, subfamily B, bacterial